MKLKRYEARSLLKYPTERLWEILTGTFVLVFEDGEITTNARETLYSSYVWNFHRLYPKTPMLMKHHVSSTLAGQRMNANTHLELLGSVMWSTYDRYIQPDEFPKLKMTEAQLRDMLSRMVYRTANVLYNDLIIRCEAYVTSMDILDFIEVVNHPKVKAVNDMLEPEWAKVESQADAPRRASEMIQKAYAVVREVLLDGVSLPNSSLARAAQSRLVKMDQLLQCVSARGLLTDIDNSQFRTPILRGYVHGFNKFYDSFIESRSAAKAIANAKAPLQQTEYFSRRLQLLEQSVQHLHPGDCGSNEYLLWTVRPSEIREGKRMASDLKLLIGKLYLGEDGKLHVIGAGDRHLVGKTIKLRSVLHCAHPDPYGVCATCFGELSLSVPENTNIGQYCCTSLAQQSSQSVLSTKHFDVSAQIDAIRLAGEMRKWLRISPDQDSYMFSETLKGKKVKLLIAPDDAPNFTDLMVVDDIRALSQSHVSELEDIGLLVESEFRGKVVKEMVPLNVQQQRRLASLNYTMLDYIREHKWTIDENTGAYVIDLAHWDFDKPFMIVPPIHFNMADHSRDIASLLESNMDQMYERDQHMSPDAVLADLFNLVNEKLAVNLAVLEMVVLGTTIISAAENMYNMPKPWTKRGLGVMKMMMMYRSGSALMAFQKHHDFLVSPDSYIYRDRPDHPMDMMIMPAEVSAAMQAGQIKSYA